jgi:hypothetical protein
MILGRPKGRVVLGMFRGSTQEPAASERDDIDLDDSEKAIINIESNVNDISKIISQFRSIDSATTKILDSTIILKIT